MCCAGQVRVFKYCDSEFVWQSDCEVFLLTVGAENTASALFASARRRNGKSGTRTVHSHRAEETQSSKFLQPFYLINQSSVRFVIRMNISRGIRNCKWS
jgi:hypothetical protein